MGNSNIYHCKCTGCGMEADVPAYPSVNASKEPLLRNRLLDGSLMRWTCPSCGKVHYLDYPLLYHDPVNKFMIWHFPAGQEEDRIDAYGKQVAGLLPDYTCRRVDNVLRLAEKIQIFEQGASDVAVELSEYVFRQEAAARANDDEEKRQVFSNNIFCHGLRFEDGRCAEFRISVVDDDGNHSYYDISPAIYSDCDAIVRRNSALDPGKGFVTVDYQWLKTKIR